MKSRNLIETEDYQHGITITEKGMQRLQQKDIQNMKIPLPDQWDGNWRLVFFDIPEKYKKRRNALTSKLRELGFQKLQKSVWIFPFPCREEIRTVTGHYGVNQYVTCIETSYIDNAEALKKRFPYSLNLTN
jgi:DNA-binding transcriptional regulator PaaX